MYGAELCHVLFAHSEPFQWRGHVAATVQLRCYFSSRHKPEGILDRDRRACSDYVVVICCIHCGDRLYTQTDEAEVMTPPNKSPDPTVAPRSALARLTFLAVGFPLWLS